EKEVSESQERFLRARADLENYKKRIEKEQAVLALFANETVVKELLPVLDSFDGALSHADNDSAVESLKEGLVHTRSLMSTILGKFGLAEITVLGQRFDPEVHEAVIHEESDTEPCTVIRELRKGYRFKDRLLRPAFVAVAKERADE
ncbi:MAG: nucleotide exchange factor GrpE, partial [Deltaproteobacteria bacterium]|nr:nucleotide exchange factor GrpE [Deltaproteobacteria bacterium]